MRQGFSRTCFLSLAQIGILVLTIGSLTAGPQQDTGSQPAAAADLSKTLNDSWSALQRNDYEAARQASLKATTIDPKNQLALFYLARAYEQLGQLPKAEETYKVLIAINPKHTSAYNNLGIVYMRLGRTDEGIASYRKQIEVNPRSRFATWNLTRALASQGQWEEASQFAAIAAELAPEDPYRRYFLGKTQAKTGHIDEARRTFERTLSLPHDAMVENDVAWEMADAGFDLDKSWQLISGALESTVGVVCEPEGLSGADKCTAQLRKMAYMLDTAGWVLYRQGKVKEAEPYLRSAFAITPHADVELHVVSMLAKSERLDEAVNEFAKTRARPDFGRADSRETVRDLVKAAGGDAELETLLERVSLPPSPLLAQAKAVALVDGNGKVLDARSVGAASPDLANVAKTLTLPSLSWPGHSIRTIRSIEFQRVGDQWVASESYAGETPPPPPCGYAPPPPLTLMTQSTPASPPRGCPGA